MQYIYLKPQLENLSQRERIAFVRQFRRMTQEELSDKYCNTNTLIVKNRR